MNKALLDTDIPSEILKAKNERIVSKAVEYKESFEQFTISVITIMEVVKGLHRVRRADALNKFLHGLQAIEVLPFDESCSIIAGRMFADLENTGQPIGRVDPMIAAIAVQHDLTLITGNKAHYEWKPPIIKNTLPTGGVGIASSTRPLEEKSKENIPCAASLDT